MYYSLHKVMSDFQSGEPNHSFLDGELIFVVSYVVQRLGVIGIFAILIFLNVVEEEDHFFQ